MKSPSEAFSARAPPPTPIIPAEDTAVHTLKRNTPYRRARTHTHTHTHTHTQRRIYVSHEHAATSPRLQRREGWGESLSGWRSRFPTPAALDPHPRGYPAPESNLEPNLPPPTLHPLFTSSSFSFASFTAAPGRMPSFPSNPPSSSFSRFHHLLHLILLHRRHHHLLRLHLLHLHLLAPPQPLYRDPLRKLRANVLSSYRPAGAPAPLFPTIPLAHGSRHPSHRPLTPPPPPPPPPPRR